MKKKNMSANYGKLKSRPMRYDMNSSYNHSLDAKAGKKILTSMINEMKRNKQDSNEGLTYSGSKNVIGGNQISGNNVHTDSVANGPIKSENSSSHSGSSVQNEKNGSTGYMGASNANYNSVNNFYGSQQYKNNKNSLGQDYNPFGLKKMHDFKDKNCSTNKKYGIHGVITNGGKKSEIEKMSSKEDDKLSKEIMSDEDKNSKVHERNIEKPENKQTEQLDDGGTEVSLLREELSLRMLKNIDEHTVDILVKSSFVTLYKMKGDELKWQRANIEGFLYIVRRSTAPMYRLIITNKRNENHLIQDVDEHIHVTTTNNYIFYKVSNASNSGKSIYSLWFFSDEEKEKIYKLLKKIIQNVKESAGVLENKESFIGEKEKKEENQENLEENEEDPCILNKSRNFTINEIPVSKLEEEQINSKIHNFLNATDIQMSRSLDMSAYNKHSSGSGKGNSNGNNGWTHSSQVTKKSSSGYNWLKTKTLNDANVHSNGTEENIVSVQSNSEEEYGGQIVARNGAGAEDTYMNQIGNTRNYHTNGIACSGISKATVGKGGGEIGTGRLSSIPKVENFQRNTEFNEKAGKKLLYLIKGISHEDPEVENNSNNNKNDNDNNNNTNTTTTTTNNNNNNNSNSVGGNRRKHRGEFYDSKEMSKRMNEQKLYHNEPSAKSGGEAIMNLLGLSKNNSMKEDMTSQKKNGSNGGMLEKNEPRGKRNGQKLKDGKSMHNGKTFINYFSKQHYDNEEEYKGNTKEESHNSTNHMLNILTSHKNKEPEKNLKQVGTCASMNSNQEEPKMMTLLDVIKSKSAKMATDQNVKNLNHSNQTKNNNSNEGKYNVQNRNTTDNDVLNCYNTDPFNVLLKMQSKIENEDIIKKMTEEIEDLSKGKKKRVDQMSAEENNTKGILTQETSIYGERNDIGTKSTHKFKITNTEIDVGLHENMNSIHGKNEKEKREDWEPTNECLTLDQNKLFNIIKETLQSDEFINLLWKNIKMNNFT